MISTLIVAGSISFFLIALKKAKKKTNIVSIKTFYDTYAEVNLSLPKGEYEPGQFVVMNFFINNKKIARAYSLSNDPSTDGYGRFIIKRVSGGIVSNFLINNINNIKNIDINGPFGDFTLNKNASRHIFVAGGSGITPIASILKSYLSKRKNDSFFLVYGNKNSQETILDDELCSLAKEYSNFKIVSFTADGSFKSLPSEQGILDYETIYKTIESFYYNENTCFYVCGPEIVIDNCKKIFDNLKIDKKNIRIEQFVSLKDLAGQEKNANTVKLTIIQDNNKEVIVDCLKNSVVLNNCLNNNIEMNYSCLSGICKMCKVTAEGNFKEKFPLLETDENGKKQILSCSTYLTEDAKVIIKKERP